MLSAVVCCWLPSGNVTAIVEPASAFPETVTKPELSEVIVVCDGAVIFDSELPPPQATKVVARKNIAIDFKKPTLIPLKVIHSGLIVFRLIISLPTRKQVHVNTCKLFKKAFRCLYFKEIILKKE